MSRLGFLPQQQNSLDFDGRFRAEQAYSQRSLTDRLLAQLQALLTQSIAADTRQQGAQLMRQLAVAAMSQSAGKSIVVNGAVIRKFTSVKAKQDYLISMGRNGAWFDDTCMKALALVLDVNLQVHVVDPRIGGGRESLISYSLNDATKAQRPQVQLINYGRHSTATRDTEAGIHWESAVMVAPTGEETRQCVQAFSTPTDGNCGAYAVFDAFFRHQRPLEFANLAERYDATATEIVVNQDSQLIRQHTRQAEQLVTTAINQHGISFSELLLIAKQLAAMKHGEHDTYLQGHITRLTAGPQHLGATLELGRVIAARAGVDGDLFQALKAGLNARSHQAELKSRVVASSATLFGGAKSTTLNSPAEAGEHSAAVRRAQ